MILAIEGASAAGKTAWCRLHLPDRHVPEAPDNVAAPDLFAEPAAVGQFWVNYAILNWQRALALEREYSLAVCDGDPFHLYYAWALWKSEVLPRTLFEIESTLYREAFARRQVGFVDHVLWIEVPGKELRRRAASDTNRRRKRHEMYLGLVSWMKAWFDGRNAVLPGSIHELNDQVRIEDLPSQPGSRRYDIGAFDELLEKLRGSDLKQRLRGSESIAHEPAGLS
jgi:hypothetical protein